MMRVVNALRSGHWPSLLGAWLHFEVSFMGWLLIGALGVPISEAFGLSATQKGLLVAAPLFSGALLRVVVGLCSDQYGAKNTGTALLICELAAVSWGWLGATNYEGVLMTALLLGAAGASFAVALPIASYAYPPVHQGLAMGVAAAGNSGTVLAMLFAPRLGQIVGWHGVFGLMLIPLGLTLVLFLILVQPDRGISRQERRQGRWESMITSVSHRSMCWVSFLYAVTFGGFVGLCSFLPILLHDQYGVDWVAAGSLTALCGLTGSLIRPIGGYVADHFGGLVVLRLAFAWIALCLALAGSLPRLSYAVIYTVLAIGAMGFGNGAVFQVVSSKFPKQMGIASGIVGAAGGFGGFLLPFCLGSLKDMTGTFQSGFWLFSTVAVIAAITVRMALQSGASDAERHPDGFSG
ncbi:MAG TPA: MFS transporter [Nitrospiraceae bacterium]|nr:MFS transporter [Nitrospiraceae bacterium]